jgi:hypothetical protein
MMDRVQGISQEIPAEMHTRRGFARDVALLWKEWLFISAQEVRWMLSSEKEDPIYMLQGTATPAVGKLFVAMHASPHTVCGEAYCIGYIDTAECSYRVYQIRLKTAFFSGTLVRSLLFVLDNKVFHEHEEWSAL